MEATAKKNFPVVQTTFVLEIFLKMIKQKFKLCCHLRMEYEFSGHPVNILVVSLKERLLPHFLLVDVSPVQ